MLAVFGNTEHEEIQSQSRIKQATYWEGSGTVSQQAVEDNGHKPTYDILRLNGADFQQ